MRYSLATHHCSAGWQYMKPMALGSQSWSPCESTGRSSTGSGTRHCANGLWSTVWQRVLVRAVLRKMNFSWSRTCFGSAWAASEHGSIKTLQRRQRLLKRLIFATQRGIVVRECHGFTNPYGLRSQVVTGMGTGWQFLTLQKPVPMTWVWQVSRALPSWVIKSRPAATTMQLHHQPHHQTAGTTTKDKTAGRKWWEWDGGNEMVEGRPTRGQYKVRPKKGLLFYLLTIQNQQNHNTQWEGYAPPCVIPARYAQGGHCKTQGVEKLHLWIVVISKSFQWFFQPFVGINANKITQMGWTF